MREVNNGKTLWYIADPMCSWCWGFAPSIEAIRLRYAEQLTIKIILGGLRPGTKHAIAKQQREEILAHWRNVQRMTGQPFQFEGAMPDGFIYDTEPASRGVVTVSTVASQLTFPFFAAIQQAFYVDQIDVTKSENLAQLASDLEIDTRQFLSLFASEAVKKQTQEHFNRAQQWGVRGFPSLIMQNEADFHLLASGYCPAEKLYPQIDHFISV